METDQAEGTAHEKARELGVFEDQNRDCPFRLTQKTDTLGKTVSCGFTFQAT